jgi:hypothetical protein
MRKSLVIGALLACASACGGSSDEGDSGKTAEELDREIRAEAEALNRCAIVQDCRPVGYACSTLYVGADADTTHLEELINDHERQTEPIACPASCACGVLTCESGQCVTHAGDCMDVPTGGMTVCL